MLLSSRTKLTHNLMIQVRIWHHREAEAARSPCLRIFVSRCRLSRRTQITVSFGVIGQHRTVGKTTHGRQSAFVLQRLAWRSWRLSCVLRVEVNRPLSELSNHEEGGHCRCLCVCTAPSAYSSRVQSAENTILQPVIQRCPSAMKYSRGEERVCVDCAKKIRQRRKLDARNV